MLAISAGSDMTIRPIVLWAVHVLMRAASAALNEWVWSESAGVELIACLATINKLREAPE